MLGKFICPASRLAELAQYNHLFSQGLPFALSILARGGKSDKDFLENLSLDLEDIARFRERHGKRVLVDSLSQVACLR